MKEYKRYLITTALPYANGPVHIGHLAGVYIPADIYARYLRLKGEDVLLIGGSDEHGVPITIKAKNENTTPQDIVDKYHSIIKKSFQDFGITFDIYSRTTSKVHHETASQFFKVLYDKNIFIEKETEQYYDPKARQFLADRYISGTCPRCKYDKAYGDQCESCGNTLNATELKYPKSVLTGDVPILKRTKHWYLPLNKYQSFLEKWILRDHKEWKPNVSGQCKSWLEEGLQPRAVSRDLDWGVPVPVKDEAGKVLYVWFDAPIGYISATKEHTPNWEKYWKDKDTKLVHFIGKDNIVFHCIIFPTMLKAEGSYILPDNVPANEFLNLENSKISTSRNWAVWLHEYLEEFKDQQDILRYVLTANAPETKDNDFTWKDFQARNNNELVAILGNFIHRTVVLVNKYYNGKIPSANIKPYKKIFDQIANHKEIIEKAIETYHFREALKETMSIARIGNKFLAETEPWKLIKTDPEQVKQILNVCAQITAKLSILIEPFLPFTAKKLQKLINIKNTEWNKTEEEVLLEEGHKLNQPELLFKKIEDKQVQYQMNKLNKTKQMNQDQNTPTIKPQKEKINFDHFMKTDIRVGKILEAKKIPQTDKLLQLKVDVGTEKRTIVSGIAEQYQPQDLIEKQVCVLLNLEPRKLRGIISEGMILMAEDYQGKLSLIAPQQQMPEGTQVL